MKTIDSVIKELQGLSNNAYVRYIQQLRQDECLGAEYKMEKGKFNNDNLKAHCTALQWLGKHRAYEDSARLLLLIKEEEDKSSWQPSETCPKDGTVFVVDYPGYDRCSYYNGQWVYYSTQDDGHCRVGDVPCAWATSKLEQT